MKTSMVGILFLCILVMSAGCGDASVRVTGKPSTEDRVKVTALPTLSTLTDELYKAANEGNRQLAFATLVRLEQAANKPHVRANGLPAGWRAFDRSLQEARNVLEGGKGSGIYLQAARLKLAIDSLEQPLSLWLQYQDVLRDDLARVRRLYSSPAIGDVTAASAALEQLRLHAERIEIAALMSKPPEQHEQLFAGINGLALIMKHQADVKVTIGKEGSLGDVKQTGRVQESLVGLESTIAALFYASGWDDATTVSAPLLPAGQPAQARELLVTMFLASLVMGVLGFVGWRKFRYEQAHGTRFPPIAPTDNGRRHH